MSHSRNWNDMSDSDEDDNDNEPQQPKQETSPTPTTAPFNPTASETSAQSQPQQPAEVEKKERTDKKTNRMTDEQLLQQYLNKTVDDPRVIKVSNCRQEEHKEMLKAMKNVRVSEVKDGLFILNFKHEEALLDFIREKIANRYRFYLQPFFKRQDNREQPHDRQKRDPRREEDRRQDRKEERREKRKEQEGGKKAYVAKDHFQIQNLKNIVHIHNDQFETSRVIQELQNKKVFKDFNKIIILTPAAAIEKVKALCADISSKKNFNFEKETPQEAGIVELLLVQNGGVKPKPVEKPKETRDTRDTRDKRDNRDNRDKPRGDRDREGRDRKQVKAKIQTVERAQKGEQANNWRVLGKDFKHYFDKIQVYNTSLIVEGFDENEYVLRLKEQSANIEKNWKSWKIEAEDEHIETLLKLSHRLKKSTIYDVELKPSLRNDKPFLTAELRPRPEKERRPKVDVSGVNGYLS